jgi:hypothetical protein
MGLRDYTLRLGSAQAFTSTGGVATHAFTLPTTGADIGAAGMALRFTLTAVSAASGTLQFQVVTSTASDGTTGQVVIVTTPALTDTTLAAGSKITLPIPAGMIPSTATHLTGKIVLASSGTCTATIDLIPQAMADEYKAYHAEPVMQ